VQLNSDSCSEYIIEPWQVAIKLPHIQLSKSPGPDDIPNWLLKEMAPLLADPICAIFNASVRQGHVSNRWKLANVVPVPKVYPPKDIRSDLRPISLTPTLAKKMNLSWVRGFWSALKTNLAGTNLEH